MANSTVGNNIRLYRKARGITLKDLAIKINRPPTTVGNWERGERDPGSDNIRILAAALEISPAELIGHNEDVVQDSSFEIICNDISMVPKIRPGDRLLITKAFVPEHMDIVVARAKRHDEMRVSPVVRFYISCGEESFLLAIDKNTPCEPVENYDVLGRVISVTRKL